MFHKNPSNEYIGVFSLIRYKQAHLMEYPAFLKSLVDYLSNGF